MKHRKSRGFTLIELMIVVAIVGIMAAVAVPAYLTYVVRARITEGLVLGSDARARVASSAAAADLAIAIDDWNLQQGGTGASSKYVASVLADRNTGEISVTFTAATGAAAGSTARLTPYVVSAGVPVQLGASLATGATGSLDWGCASATNVTSSARGLPPLVAATLLAKYAPSECR